jgi:hypothetical protein
MVQIKWQWQGPSMRARELTVPNGNMQGNVSLVDWWIELLARQNEREVEQIDELLEDQGGIPSPEDEPSGRALWVGALIILCWPWVLSLAMEIRPT